MNPKIRSLPVFAFAFFFMLVVTIAFSSDARAQAVSEPKPMGAAEAALRTELAFLEGAIDETQDAISTVSAGIRKNTELLRSSGVSDLAFDDVFRLLHVQKVELAIELKGFEARLALLDKDLAADKELDPLERIQQATLVKQLELLRQRLDLSRRLTAKGARSNYDLKQAEGEFAVAELNLKTFEMKATQPTPAQVNAVFETSLAIAERKAKLEAVKEMLAKHVDSRPKVAELKELSDARSHEIERLRSLDTEFRQLKQKAKAKF